MSSIITTLLSGDLLNQISDLAKNIRETITYKDIINPIKKRNK